MRPPCKEHRLCRLLNVKKGRHVRLDDLYRQYLGKREGQKIWIVDGEKAFRGLYPAFIMGGNDQRYRFNPLDDVWIDDRIAVGELEYTIAHELLERKLMRERRWTYGKAHKHALALEKEMREADLIRAAKHERRLDRQGIKLPRGIYLQFWGSYQGLKVWIVDGFTVRRELDGNFSYGNHGLKDPYVPAGEIWIDTHMAVTQLWLQIVQESTEHQIISAGNKYGLAYSHGLLAQAAECERQENLVREHEAGLAPVRLGVRERGVRARRKRA